MTVIAYRDGVMAADSQVTDSGADMVYGEVEKITTINGWLIGAAHSLIHTQQFFRWMRGSKIEPDWGLVHGVAIRPDGRMFEFDHAKTPFEMKCEHGFAIGSGARFAIAAMMAGADAMKAVEIAMALDSGCGGPLKVLSLDAP